MTRNQTTVAAVTVLVAALAGLLVTLGVSAPWMAAVAVLAPVVTSVAQWGVDTYVRFVGPENTSADEIKAAAQDAIQDAADAVRGDK